MTGSPRLALGSSDTRSAIRLLNLDTGEHVPVATPLDNDGAFDAGLGRRGWVAAQVQYQVGGYCDGGDLRSPALLPEAWTILPAATDDLVLLRRYFGHSSLPGEPMRVVVVGQDGAVHRSADLPWSDSDGDQVAGELPDAVVTTAGIFGWDGEIRPLPGDRTGDPFTDPLPVAVLAGRVILFEGMDYLESVDVSSGTRNRIPVPARHRRWPGPADPRFEPGRWYNAAGTWLVAGNGRSRSREDCVVAGPAGEIRWLPDLPRAVNLWLGDKLVRWSWEDGRPVEYDPVTDRFSRTDVAPVAPMRSDSEMVAPRVEVTGRFDWPG